MVIHRAQTRAMSDPSSIVSQSLSRTNKESLILASQTLAAMSAGYGTASALGSSSPADLHVLTSCVGTGTLSYAEKTGYSYADYGAGVAEPEVGLLLPPLPGNGNGTQTSLPGIPRGPHGTSNSLRMSGTQGSLRGAPVYGTAGSYKGPMTGTAGSLGVPPRSATASSLKGTPMTATGGSLKRVGFGESA